MCHSIIGVNTRVTRVLALFHITQHSSIATSQIHSTIDFGHNIYINLGHIFNMDTVYYELKRKECHLAPKKNIFFEMNGIINIYSQNK